MPAWLQTFRPLRIGERVAGIGLLETDRGGDVAGADLLDLLARVGVELDDAADALGACESMVEQAGGATPGQP